MIDSRFSSFGSFVTGLIVLHFFVLVPYVFGQPVESYLDQLDTHNQSIIAPAVRSICQTDDLCEIDPMAAGFSAANLFTIAKDGKKYVLKISDPTIQLDQMILAFATQIEAAQYQIAPTVYYADPFGRVILTALVEGPTLNQAYQSHPERLFQVARALHVLNQLPTRSPSFTSLDVISMILQSANKKGASLPSLLPSVLEILHKIRRALEPTTDLVRAHGDLVPANIIMPEHGAVFVDWDYSRASYRYEDLATVAFHLRLSDQAQLKLLTDYLGKTPSSRDIAQFYLLRRTALIVGFAWAMEYPFRAGLPAENLHSTAELNQLLDDPALPPAALYVFPAERSLSLIEIQEFGISLLKQFLIDVSGDQFRTHLAFLYSLE